MHSRMRLHANPRSLISIGMGAVLMMLGLPASASNCPDDHIVDTRVRPVANAEDQSGRGSLDGEAVHILARKGKSVQISHGSKWLPAEDVISVKKARPLSRWTHAEFLEVGDGDYNALYRVKRNGDFSVFQNVQDPTTEQYYPVLKHGRFYAVGNILWARISNECLWSSSIFVKRPQGICWRYFIGDTVEGCGLWGGISGEIPTSKSPAVYRAYFAKQWESWKRAEAQARAEMRGRTKK